MARMSRAERLSGGALQRLSRLSNIYGLRDVLVTWIPIAGCAWGAHAFGGWLANLAAIVIIASRQAALANLAHDAWHRLGFGSRKLNDLVGAWCYAYPVGVPFFHDRRRHFQHHRLVGERRDPDWVNYTSDGRETPAKIIGYLARRLGGALLVETAWSALVTRKPRIVLEDQPKSDEPAHEMLRVVVCQILLIVAFTWSLGPWGYALYWLLPLATVTAFCNNLRALVEHIAEGPEPSAAERLRDIDANVFERWFFSPAHFHFHALHHEHPSIPHYRLGKAKAELVKELGAYPFAVSPGYLATLRSHLAAITRSRTAK